MANDIEVHVPYDWFGQTRHVRRLVRDANTDHPITFGPDGPGSWMRHTTPDMEAVELARQAAVA